MELSQLYIEAVKAEENKDGQAEDSKDSSELDMLE